MRILHVVRYNIEKNGIMTFLLNYGAMLSKKGIIFDVIAPGKCIDHQIKEQICLWGGRVYELDVKKSVIWTIPFYLRFQKFLKTHPGWEIVHIDTGLQSLQAAACGACGRRKIRRVVVHSHGCVAPRGKWKTIKRLRLLTDRYIVSKNAAKFIACSEEAGVAAFSENIKDLLILKNAVSTRRFQFDKEEREKIRRQLGVRNKKVVGHIGSFIKIKNHEFLLEVFREIKKREKQAHLLLAGDGELQEKIKKQAEDMGLAEAVSFLGTYDNIAPLLQAMDVFIFPSFAEGVPYSCIEAQCAGLPCLISEGVSKEVKILPGTEMIALSDGKERWAKAAIEKLNNLPNREGIKKYVEDAGFELEKACGQLERCYETLSD